MGFYASFLDFDKHIFFPKTFYSFYSFVNEALEGRFSLLYSRFGLVIPPSERKRISLIKGLFDVPSSEKNYFSKKPNLLSLEAFLTSVSEQFDNSLAEDLFSVFNNDPEKYFFNNKILLLNDSLLSLYLDKTKDFVINDDPDYLSSLDSFFNSFSTRFRYLLNGSLSVIDEPVNALEVKDVFRNKNIYSDDDNAFINNLLSLKMSSSKGFANNNFFSKRTFYVNDVDSYSGFCTSLVNNILVEDHDGVYFVNKASVFLLKRLLL